MADLSSSTASNRFVNPFDEEKEPVEKVWSDYDLEYDLRTTDWILEKVRGSESYAQNLYAAMCNNQFQKIEVLPILKNQVWHCSWRRSGGIIADMRQQGDYLDWYCSGMGGLIEEHEEMQHDGFVPEGKITQEVLDDLKQLKWAVVTKENDDD